MQKPAGIESRRTPRRVFNRAIGILHNGEYTIQQSLQLSEGGMLFSCDFPLAKGDRIVATLLLPGGDGLLFRGEIIYSQQGAGGAINYGVRFSNVALHHKRMVRNYVSAKTAAEAEDEREWEH